MVNRLRGVARKKLNKKHFIMLEGSELEQVVYASKTGQRWKAFEDAVIIAAGSEDSEELDAQLAAQLGRTPAAVRARRAKLKKQGKL